MATASRSPASWHAALRAASSHRAAGRLTEALSCCDGAVSAVDGLLDGASLDSCLLMAKTLAHLHRAAVLDQLERSCAADHEYRSAWSFARAVADDACRPAKLRRAACGHARVAFAAWQGARGAPCQRSGLAPAPAADPQAREAPHVLH